MSKGTKDKKAFSTAVGLTRRTMPFLLLNLLVYGLFFLGTVLWLGIFGGIAFVTAERIPLVAIIAFIIGVGGPWPLIRLFRRYILYMVQGAHIAVSTKLLLEGSIPEGKGQVEYGRERVKELFRDVSILFLLDRLIDGTVRTFTRSFVRIVDMLPLGGAMSSVARIGATIINRSLSYVDEAILSYAVAKDQPNVWRSGRHGLILYAQAYKPILGTAVRIWLLGRLFWLAALLLIGVPGILLTLAVVPTMEMQFLIQIIVVVAALILASMLEKAIFEPFAMIYTLTAYHRAIDGLEVNAVWDRRLQNVSKRFRELVGKAQEADGQVDPLDQVDVPQQAIESGNGGASPRGGGVATQAPAGSQPSGGGGFAGLSSGGRRSGGIGGLVGGMISQAAGNIAQGQQAPGPSPAPGGGPAPAQQPPATNPPPAAQPPPGTPPSAPSQSPAPQPPAAPPPAGPPGAAPAPGGQPPAPGSPPGGPPPPEQPPGPDAPPSHQD